MKTDTGWKGRHLRRKSRDSFSEPQGGCTLLGQSSDAPVSLVHLYPVFKAKWTASWSWGSSCAWMVLAHADVLIGRSCFD